MRERASEGLEEMRVVRASRAGIVVIVADSAVGVRVLIRLAGLLFTVSVLYPQGTRLHTISCALFVC